MRQMEKLTGKRTVERRVFRRFRKTSCDGNGQNTKPVGHCWCEQTVHSNIWTMAPGTKNLQTNQRHCGEMITFIYCSEYRQNTQVGSWSHHHTRPEYCKDDYSSQWVNLKLDPPHHTKLAEPIITQLCIGNSMSGSPTLTQNFITIRSGVFDPHIGEIVFTRLLFYDIINSKTWFFATNGI